MDWIQHHPRFTQATKSKYSSIADGWLVACAKTRGATVVTNEQSAPESKKAIKLPDVCNHFGVSCVNTFEMLRQLDVQFDWTEANK